MKLLDRYVILSFLKNYLISFLVLVGMYIVLDMIFQFDELVEVNARQNLGGFKAILNFIYYTGDFYMYQSLLYFVHLSGMISVVAAAFTFMRMTRFNELGALLSAGVPVLRVAMPIIAVALVLQGLLWVDQEILIPNNIQKLVRKHDYGASTESFRISAMRDDRNGKLFASRYDPTATPPRMEVVDVVQMDDSDRVTHIRASAAEWDPQNRWWALTGGTVESDCGRPGARVQAPQPIKYYQSDITPEEIRLYRSGNFVDLLSTDRINELLKRPMSYGRNALLRVKHSRGLAQIALNMILLLLALSAVATRDPQQLKSAATKCVILCGACLSTAFMAQQMAGNPPLNPALADRWPAIMAWMPIFMFSPTAVIMLARVKT